MRVAIVGTRSPTAEQFAVICDFTQALAERNIELATGFSDGVDMACFEVASRVRPSALHLYLPWRTFNQPLVNGRCKYTFADSIHVHVYDPQAHHDWTASVHQHHPNPTALTKGGFLLQARNYGIVMDPAPVAAVLALPRSLTDFGGTGQAMRIAAAYGIPCYNLRLEQDFQRARSWVKSL